jgi:flagellar biosynthesis/type III secretory pathway chaperone
MTTIKGADMTDFADDDQDRSALAALSFDLREVTELVDRLTAILDEETALIDEGRIAEIEPLQVEKNRLSAAIRQGTGSLEPIIDLLYETEDPDIAADRDDMIDAVLMLKDASEQNERVLRAALRATSRLVSALVHTARNVANEDARAYSAGGNVVKNMPGGPSGSFGQTL